MVLLRSYCNWHDRRATTFHFSREKLEGDWNVERAKRHETSVCVYVARICNLFPNVFTFCGTVREKKYSCDMRSAYLYLFLSYSLLSDCYQAESFPATSTACIPLRTSFSGFSISVYTYDCSIKYNFFFRTGEPAFSYTAVWQIARIAWYESECAGTR